MTFRGLETAEVFLVRFSKVISRKAHAHAAESDGGYFEVALSKLSLLHLCSLGVSGEFYRAVAAYSFLSDAMSIEKRYFTSDLSILS